MSNPNCYTCITGRPVHPMLCPLRSLREQYAKQEVTSTVIRRGANKNEQLLYKSPTRKAVDLPTNKSITPRELKRMKSKRTSVSQ